MTAVTRSRMECRASERTPRLPVIAARNTLRDTSTTAEPTEPSAAIRFSRLPCSIVVELIRGIIRCGAPISGLAGGAGSKAAILEGSSLHGRRRIEREAAGFAVEATNLDIVEQERRSDDRARDAILGRTKSAKGRAAKAFLRVQHVGEDRWVVADR